MYITDNPILDFARHDAEQQSALNRLPKCADCGEPITDEHFYLINDEFICQSCLDENYKKCVDDYIA